MLPLALSAIGAVCLIVSAWLSHHQANALREDLLKERRATAALEISLHQADEKIGQQDRLLRAAQAYLRKGPAIDK